jgi:DNA-binding LytR/AlgR family response regulator
MIKAIIADTENAAIGNIETLLDELWPELVICGCAGSGPEALQLIQRHKPQLAFLEVRLPGICGMQVARMVSSACQVVFTTGFDHYAVNAFDGGALDYLLKPVSRRRLQKAVQRAKQQLGYLPRTQLSEDGFSTTQPLDPLMLKKKNYLQWICTKNGVRSKLIDVARICYFKADHKYTAVITREGDSLINKPIKTLLDELDPSRFWQIHRSTIVNVTQIEAVSRSNTGRGAVQLKDRSEVLTVSRPYLHLFKQM